MKTVRRKREWIITLSYEEMRMLRQLIFKGAAVKFGLRDEPTESQQS